MIIPLNRKILGRRYPLVNPFGRGIFRAGIPRRPARSASPPAQAGAAIRAVADPRPRSTSRQTGRAVPRRLITPSNGATAPGLSLHPAELRRYGSSRHYSEGEQAPPAARHPPLHCPLSPVPPSLPAQGRYSRIQGTPVFDIPQPARAGAIPHAAPVPSAPPSPPAARRWHHPARLPRYSLDRRQFCAPGSC